MATTADLFFVIHDWMFTVEIMMASLTMPVVIKFFDEGNVADDDEQDAEYQRSMKRVKCIKWSANSTYYTLTIGWYVVSLITGSFIWRMSVNLLYFFITSVFLVALLSIRRMITAVNTNERLKPNKSLMTINLVTFSFEFLVSLIVLILATQV